MHRRVWCVLFVSHNLDAVEILCTLAVWIDSGQVVMDGATRAVIQSYMASFSGEDTVADLSECETRRGTGHIRYTSLEFLSANGTRQKLIRSGDSLVMRFHYRAETPIRLPSFGFQLFTELGT